MEILTAAALHELGHIAVLTAAGAKIHGLRLGVCGAVLQVSTADLSYGWELAAVLAGPLVNLFCAVALLLWKTEQGAIEVGIHLALFGFNLLPLRPLDGGRALCLALAWVGDPFSAARITAAAGALTGTFLSMLLIWVMWKTGGSLWLLPAVAGLLTAVGRECFRKGDFL